MLIIKLIDVGQDYDHVDQDHDHVDHHGGDVCHLCHVEVGVRS